MEMGMGWGWGWGWDGMEMGMGWRWGWDEVGVGVGMEMGLEWGGGDTVCMGQPLPDPPVGHRDPPLPLGALTGWWWRG